MSLVSGRSNVMDVPIEVLQPVRFEQVRPLSSAPAASAPYDVRAAWSRDYVSWFIMQTPQDGSLPPEVRSTHRFEIEFEACVPDPQAYERQTLAELRKQPVH
jgi:hypothetical protein